jgi:hypothetical protein
MKNGYFFGSTFFFVCPCWPGVSLVAVPGVFRYSEGLCVALVIEEHPGGRRWFVGIGDGWPDLSARKQGCRKKVVSA